MNAKFKLLFILVLLLIGHINHLFATNNADEMAHQFIEQKDYHGCISYCDSLILVNENDVNAHHYRGIANIYLNEFEKAKADLEFAFALKPKDETILLNLARTKMELGEYNESIEDLQLVHELNKDDAEAYVIEGICYYKLHDEEKAMLLYDSALILYPDFDIALFNKSLIYYNQKDYDRCLEEIKKALNVNPSLIEAKNTKADAYFMLDKYDEAIKEYTDILRLDARNINANNGLGMCYYMLQDYKKAKDYYRLSLKNGANDADIFANAAKAFYMLNETDDALKYYTKSIALDSTDASIYMERANCYEVLKKYELAINDLEKAKSLDSSVNVDVQLKSLKTNAFINTQLLYILIAIFFILLAIILTIIYFVKRNK